MLKKLVVIVCILFATGCVSVEKRIEDISLEFGNKLHEYSFSNPKWQNQLELNVPSMNLSEMKNKSEIYQEYLEKMENAFEDLADENGLEQIKEYLLKSRIHAEKDEVKFVELNEYDHSYNSVIEMTGSHYKLRCDISFMKNGSKPLIGGFKISVIEFENPE